MAGSLILLVMVIYFITGVNLLFKGNFWLGLVFICYGFSNLGLYKLS
jgi:hypothetical protein